MFLTNVTISIPFKSAGNSIVQKPVDFEVYREEDIYTIKPLLSLDELRLANLPGELKFIYNNGHVESLHGIKDGNLHVMQDVYTALSDINFKKL